MSDTAYTDAPLRVRNPQAFSLGVAVFMGCLGIVLQSGAAVPAAGLTAWEIGALLATLVLWSMPTLEASTLAFTRRDHDWTSFAALAFAYGYFWTVCLILMQWGSAPLFLLWAMFGAAGALFGVLLARAQSDRNALQLDPLFEPEHALSRNPVIGGLFLAWPLVVIAGLSLLIANAGFGVVPLGQMPTVLLMVLVIWPMSYDVTARYRRVYLTNIGLGALLLGAVALF